MNLKGIINQISKSVEMRPVPVNHMFAIRYLVDNHTESLSASGYTLHRRTLCGSGVSIRPYMPPCFSP